MRILTFRGVLPLLAFLLCTSFITDSKKQSSAETHKRPFCDPTFVVDNQTFSATVTDMRIPGSGNVLLDFPMSVTAGNSYLVASNLAVANSTITIKGSISGFWNRVDVVESSTSNVVGTCIKSGSGSHYQVFNIPIDTASCNTYTFIFQ